MWFLHYKLSEAKSSSLLQKSFAYKLPEMYLVYNILSTTTADSVFIQQKIIINKYY